MQRVTGQPPEFSTTGGTSDARFIKDHCPVAELGLAGATMHKADECASLEDIEILTRIYQAILEDYFANPPRGKRIDADQPIGVFDSGMGGLTVMRALWRGCRTRASSISATRRGFPMAARAPTR